MRKMKAKTAQKQKALLLLSGGFDSPVAGLLMREKGLGLEAVHFSSEIVTGKESTEKAKRLAKFLGLEKLFVCDISEPLIEFSRKCRHEYYFVLMKRLMYRIAERIAEREQCGFLATGENLGQVSSQTIENLYCIDASTKMQVLRPLIGFDKNEIIELAKKLGTHDTSIGVEHCDALGPTHPITKARLQDVLREEEKVPAQEFVEKALASLKVTSF